MLQNNGTSSEPSSSVDAKSIGLALLSAFGWVPALALLYILILLIKSVVHLKRRIFGGPQWWVDNRKVKKVEKRISGMRTRVDLLGELWKRGVGCVWSQWMRLWAGKREVKDGNVDVEMGDIEKQRRRDSGSTEGAWSIGTTESFSSVTPIVRKEKDSLEIKAAPTTWSRIKSFFQLRSSIFRRPQQSSTSATEAKNTRDRIKAAGTKN